MNSKANAVLDNIRKTLETELESRNGVAADGGLTEAEQKFCEEGLAFIKGAEYEMEGFEEVGPDEVIEALASIAEDDENHVSAVEALFKKYGVVEVEG